LDPNDDTNTKDFIDLLAADVRAKRHKSPLANVIKAGRVAVKGIRRVELPETGGDTPRIVLHREGEEVQRVEFVCKCGRTASLHIQYEGE
jgi:hypothetical protein